MVKLEMVHQEQIDYIQLQLTIRVFYMERVFYRYLLVVFIHVRQQMKEIHIVGDKIGIIIF
jgi:hypothetical protein